MMQTTILSAEMWWGFLRPKLKPNLLYRPTQKVRKKSHQKYPFFDILHLMLRGRIIFLLIWLLLLLPGPITALRISPIASISSNQILLVNFYQRAVALVAFSMLFVQLILGAFMTRFTQKLGGWALKFHLLQGATIYSLVFLHPLLFVLMNFKAKGVIDPFYVFTEVCVLCSNRQEFWYTLGRLSFWLITLAVAAAKLRNQPWWRVHWRKFHVLNYFTFFLIATHAWFSGTDVWEPPFVYLYWISVAGVFLTVIYKLYPVIKGYLRAKSS